MANDPTPPPSPNLTPAKMSGMAVTSLVLGILGLFSCGFTALFGLILGVGALVKVKKSCGKVKGDGLALAGIIVSGIFTIMIPIFAVMLLRALAASIVRSQTINYVSNERQLALAVQIYLNNHTNHFPAAATWCDAIKSNDGWDRVFQYPGVTTTTTNSCIYAFNAALGGMDESDVNPHTVMIFEADGGWNANGGREMMVVRHEHGRICVVTLADGSVQEVRSSQLDALRWNP